MPPTPNRAVPNINQGNAVRSYYNTFPPYQQEKEDIFTQYEEVLKMIEDSEKRVDEMLKAARLERHERKPMSNERLQMILNYAVGTVAMVLGFGAVFMIIYFCGTGGR